MKKVLLSMGAAMALAGCATHEGGTGRNGDTGYGAGERTGVWSDEPEARLQYDPAQPNPDANPWPHKR